MKWPTKEEFIVENQEEEIEIQRKVKVKILDPDATESSSDDEQETRPKLIVHEIAQEKVKIQSFSLKKENPLDLSLFSGKLPPMVRKSKSGKFGTEIRNPFNKKRIWLGTFDTAEEACQVYQSKKLEFDEILRTAKNVIERISAKSEIGSSSRNPPLMVDSQTSDSSKVKARFSLKNRNPLNFDQFSGKLPSMVRKRKSGKFVAEIRDPFIKKRIWLGTFNTAEEACQVYQSKKLEFEEKLKMAKNVIEAISAKSEIGSSSRNSPLMVDSQTSDSSKVETHFSLKNRNPLNFDQFSGKLPSMVLKRKSGKFVAEIRDPFIKKRIWLGTFNTAEEACQIYQSKKLEFEEKLKMAKNVIEGISAKSEIRSSSRNSPLMVDSQTSDSSKVETRFSLKNRNPLKFDQFSGKLPPMVRKRKSGKFVAEIRDPFNKKRIWLGTFNTAEEACQVHQSKKLEFEEKLKEARSALVKKTEKSELCPSSSSNPPLMVYSQNTDSSSGFEERMKKAKNAKVEKIISAKSEIGSSSCDPPLMVDSQTSDSSNWVEEKDGQESEEEMWMGQWVQISGDKEVKFSQKLGVPVVDNYGFLLGEFSKLDDLSISV